MPRFATAPIRSSFLLILLAAQSAVADAYLADDIFNPFAGAEAPRRPTPAVGRARHDAGLTDGGRDILQVIPRVPASYTAPQWAQQSTFRGSTEEQIMDEANRRLAKYGSMRDRIAKLTEEFRILALDTTPLISVAGKMARYSSSDCWKGIVSRIPSTRFDAKEKMASWEAMLEGGIAECAAIADKARETAELAWEREHPEKAAAGRMKEMERRVKAAETAASRAHDEAMERHDRLVSANPLLYSPAEREAVAARRRARNRDAELTRLNNEARRRDRNAAPLVEWEREEVDRAAQETEQNARSMHDRDADLARQDAAAREERDRRRARNAAQQAEWERQEAEWAAQEAARKAQRACEIAEAASRFRRDVDTNVFTDGRSVPSIDDSVSRLRSDTYDSSPSIHSSVSSIEFGRRSGFDSSRDTQQKAHSLEYDTNRESWEAQHWREEAEERSREAQQRADDAWNLYRSF